MWVTRKSGNIEIMYAIKQSENKEKKIWDGNPEGFVRLVQTLVKTDYPLLSGIALYEDTYFNHQQIPMFITELKRLLIIIKPEDKNEVQNFIDFASAVELGEHLIVIGD